MSKKVDSEDSLRDRLPDISWWEVVGIVLVLGFPTWLSALVSVTFGQPYVYHAPWWDLHFWYPKFHVFFYGIPHIHPVFTIYLLGGGLVALAGTIILKLRGEIDEDMRLLRLGEKAKAQLRYRPVGTVLLALGIVMMLAVVPVGMVASYEENVHLQERTDAKLSQTDTLPEMSGENPRVLTRSVAREYAQNSIQYNKYKVGETDDITFINGTPHWSYPLVSDTTPKRYYGHQKGTIYVDMTSQAKDVKICEPESNGCPVGREMEYGMGVSITDKVMFQTIHSDPGAIYKDPFQVTHDGNNSIVIPKVRYEHHTSYGIVPYSVPVFDGVAIVHDDGEIEHLTPEQARTNPITEGQNFYPYDLSMREMKSLTWRNGTGMFGKTMNHEFEKSGVFEVPDLPGEGNGWPLLVDTEEGKKYFASVRPSGSGSGIYRLYWVDAQTGEFEELKFEQGNTLTGPDKAPNYVKQDIPQAFQSDRFSIAEPLPVVIDQKVYWMVRVVAPQNSGISYVSFVDAKNTDNVHTFKETEDAITFMRGGDVPQSEGDTAQNVSEVAQIVVERSDGTIEEINLTEGDSVTIEMKGNSSS